MATRSNTTPALMTKLLYNHQLFKTLLTNKSILSKILLISWSEKFICFSILAICSYKVTMKIQSNIPNPHQTDFQKECSSEEKVDNKNS